MSIKYVCRHCHTPIGEIMNDQISEYQLGFHFLTPEERKDIISYNSDSEVMVKVICDYCKEALDAHPELSLITNPLQ